MNTNFDWTDTPISTTTINQRREQGADVQELINELFLTREGKVDKQTLIFWAEKQHEVYPQYNGHWDNGWEVVKMTRNVTTKLGQAFKKGDWVLRATEKTELPSWNGTEICTAHYSFRNAAVTLI